MNENDNPSNALEQIVRAKLKDAETYYQRTCEGGRGEIANISQTFYAGRAAALQEVLREWESCATTKQS